MTHGKAKDARICTTCYLFRNMTAWVITGKAQDEHITSAIPP
jgi:hypothetical protein